MDNEIDERGFSIVCQIIEEPDLRELISLPAELHWHEMPSLTSRANE